MMTSLLRQIVAGPRVKHQDTGLDLCYVTDNIIATSGPSQTYPQRAYRNPLDRLVTFLDSQHGEGWAIWEFRAEGTGYPDEAVYHRIRHYPWPDHHPPPFKLVPMIVAGMKRWLEGGELHHGAVAGEGGGGGDAAACVLAPMSIPKPNTDQRTDADTGETTEQDARQGKRVVVVHCKAGKGRSGTMACSYLIAECGWTAEDALARFTERRMRPGFGAGVSIPSQLRWISYVDRWTKGGKKFVDRAVEIVEVHVWNLRHGVKVAVEGFAEEGKKIKVIHTFGRDERIVVEGDAPGGGGVVDLVSDMAKYGIGSAAGPKGEVAEGADYEGVVEESSNEDKRKSRSLSRSPSRKIKGLARKISTRRNGSSPNPSKLGENGEKRSKTIAIPEAFQTTATDTSLPDKNELRSQSNTSLQNAFSFANSAEPGGQAVIFKPAVPVHVPNGDVNIAIERRNRAPGNIGLTMVTAVAHVWFNAFFEGNGPEQDGKPDDSGVFEIEWDKMDGIKGSSQRGTRACDRLSVVWRFAGEEPDEGEQGVPEAAPKLLSEEDDVPEMTAADWTGKNTEDQTAEKHLGLRVEQPDSEAASKASSVVGQEDEGEEEDRRDDDSLKGVKVSGPAGEEVLGEAAVDTAIAPSAARDLERKD